MTSGPLPALGMLLGLFWFFALVIPYGMFKRVIRSAK